MPTEKTELTDTSPRPWQYSLKLLLIVTTGVCIWAKMAVVLYALGNGPPLITVAFVVWFGALLAQGALFIWAWRQIDRMAGMPHQSSGDQALSGWAAPQIDRPDRPASDELVGRFRTSVFWGIVPLSLWLLWCLLVFREGNGSDGLVGFMGLTDLHIALPAALILIASTRRATDVYPLRVVRWSVVVSCLVPVLGVALAFVMGYRM